MERLEAMEMWIWRRTRLEGMIMGKRSRGRSRQSTSMTSSNEWVLCHTSNYKNIARDIRDWLLRQDLAFRN
jgi:hypothetical protein